jgi:hypothetical protein
MKDCCGGYGKHLMACERKLAQGTERAAKDVRLPGKVNVVLGSEPLLPHSVEVQHNWTDAELYPHSSFTFKPAQPLPVKPGAKRKEKSKEAESESEEDDEYSSSEDEEEVLNLDAPSGKTVMELLAEKEAQGERAEQPKARANPLGEGLIKTAPPKEGSPSLKTGEEGGGARDEAMEMALRIKDPKIQATMARALNTTRLGTTGSKDSDSTKDEEEEERVSAKEGARKEEG